MLLSFVRLLGRLWRTSRKPAPSRKPRRRASLQVEQLETRWVPAVISGYVFNDLNANGVIQAGESGVTVGNQTGGQTVQLQDSNGNVLGTTQTGTDGSYSFNVNPATQSTPAQSYTFADALTGMTQTSPPPQNGQQAISQFNSALGVLESVTITENDDITIDPTIQNLEPDSRTITAAVSGSINLTADGVSVPSSTTLQANLPDYNPTGIDATAHDYGPQDLTGTSTFTITDPTALQTFTGNGSVSLTEKANATLYWPDGQPANVNSGSTGSGGATVTITYNYAPATSQYKVVLVQNPPGYTAGPWTKTNGQELTTPTGQEAIGVTINNSNNANNNNFAFYQQASIKGVVYNDANNDGTRDNGETVINGTITPVTVTLQGPGGTQTTPLGADGTYSFNNLTPGTYSVSITTPGGYVAALANNVEVPPATAASTQYSSITLNSGVQGTNFNFGVYQGGSLSGHVYQDTGTTTPTPLPGISVTLINAVTGATVGTTTTDSNGVYSFTNLPVGEYTITKAAAVSPLADEKKVVGSLNVDPNRGTTATADQFFVNLGTPASGNNVGTGYDFYENEVSISGTVYNDANDDGVQDNGEQVINGSTTPVTVTLQGPGGTQTTTQVASNGTYSFSNLAPGTYSVQVTTPNGYLAGIANSAESPKGTAASTQYTGIVLGTGQQGTNFNFGIYQGDSLSGHVFLDAGGVATGLTGIKVTLTNTAGQVVATTTTDDNGAYQFNNLLMGSYTITKAPPAQGLSNEKKVVGNLLPDASRTTTPTADQFFVALGTPGSNQSVGTGYDFYEDINLKPPPLDVPIMTVSYKSDFVYS